jgi:hypothetical protein
MKIDKLNLLSKGWKVSEIEHASQIIDEAENKKGTKIKFIDGLLLAVMGCVMLANGIVSAILLVPFIYATKLNLVLILSATIGFTFSILLTAIIYDIEQIHHKHETNLFIAFITNGVINFYLILEFTAKFGKTTGLTLTENIYLIAGAYLIAFIIPHAVYQMRKKRIMQ